MGIAIELAWRERMRKCEGGRTRNSVVVVVVVVAVAVAVAVLKSEMMF